MIKIKLLLDQLYHLADMIINLIIF